MKDRESDLKFLRKSFDLAEHAAAKGIHPFAALLVDDQGQVLMEQVNAYLPDLDMTGNHPENPTLDLPCRTVFESGQREVEVLGPLLEDEAAAIHESFWRTQA